MIKWIKDLTFSSWFWTRAVISYYKVKSRYRSCDDHPSAALLISTSDTKPDCNSLAQAETDRNSATEQEKNPEKLKIEK